MDTHRHLGDDHNGGWPEFDRTAPDFPGRARRPESPVDGPPTVAIRYIGEGEAERRCVKPGWYEIGARGALGSGPFPNRSSRSGRC
jgi:hypothetical protein